MSSFNAVFLPVQVWCETNLRRCISKFHRFVCESCDKAFPLRSALDLHKTKSHPDKRAATSSEDTAEKAKEEGEGSAENEVENDQQDADKEALPAEQADFLEGLGLQHVSKVCLEIWHTSRPFKLKAQTEISIQRTFRIKCRQIRM